MNIQPWLASAQQEARPAGNARTWGLSCLAVLALLTLLAACGAPPAAEQAAAEPRVVKAIEQSKPAMAITKPLPASEPRPIATPTASPSSTATPAPTATPAATATPARDAQTVALGTNGGEWQFDLSMLEIAAEKDVSLTFSNGAKTTPHNWLLIDGDDYAAIEISQAGAQAGQSASYIPDDARVVASSAGLVRGGQSETITFAAPPAGTYMYLCTVPGHYELGMYGVMVVR